MTSNPWPKDDQDGDDAPDPDSSAARATGAEPARGAELWTPGEELDLASLDFTSPGELDDLVDTDGGWE